METLNCSEIDYETIDIEKETGVSGSTSIKLNLPKINDSDFPTVSIVTPTYNRKDFFSLIMRNWERIDYPKEKLELIILDDSPKAKKPDISDKQIRYYIHDKKLTIGQKRNMLCEYAKNEYIVHMDDDDWYPPESVACRIRILLKFEKAIKKDACFGCTKVLCLDLITNQMFEAFDSSIEGEPATISESTMAYSKRYWSTNKWDNSSKFAECLPFIENRHKTVCSGPSVFIITQFSHDNNTVQRRIKKTHVSEYNSIRFENSLSAVDSKIFNGLRASVISKIPVYQDSLRFVADNKEQSVEKFTKNYRYLDVKIKSNPLVIDLYRKKTTLKTTTSGKDIVYYCGPGTYLNFGSRWNPNSVQLGGSEEAVINLSKELVKKGYNVTVFCVLEGSSKDYDGVKYKPYYQWIPGDLQDITIIWRDPSNCKEAINSHKIFLDLHDALDPEWLKDLDFKIKYMVKSKYHCKLINMPNARIIPNGIYTQKSPTGEGSLQGNKFVKIKNMMVCTSSPDRCIRALLRAIPLIRKEVPDAEIHWAYGFKAGVSEGGMEKDDRCKEWVVETKKLIQHTDGFKDLGRLSQIEVNELYKKAEFFVYPTRFPEIDCVSLSKAMFYGCVPICTPSGAMAEKLSTNKQYAKNCSSIDYSLEEGDDFDSFVKAAITLLKKQRNESLVEDISIYAQNNYSMTSVVEKWISLF